MSTTQRCCALVQEYDPELDKRCRPYLHPTNDSWRVDETYIARQEAINALIKLLRTSQSEETCHKAAINLVENLETKGYLFPVVVAGFKITLTKQVRENDFEHYKNRYKVLWHCSQNMSYPDFYQAWYSQPSTSHPEVSDNLPAGLTPTVQSLETKIADIYSQLQPTTKTYPLCIDAEALAGETDIGTVAQELCTQIYLAASLEEEMPEDTVNSAVKLKPKILQVKKRLQKQHLALILHDCQPHRDLVNFCRQQLLPGLKFLHIGWITDQPLKLPLKGFPPNQLNLLSAIQSWINEIQ